MGKPEGEMKCEDKNILLLVHARSTKVKLIKLISPIIFVYTFYLKKKWNKENGVSIK